MITVSSYNYDHDARDSFTTWELPVADDIKCSSVTVVVENDVPNMEILTLTDDDLQYIGEYYSYGYFDFNEAGEVTSIIFYGETLIWA